MSLFSQDIAAYRKMIGKAEQNEADAIVYMNKAKSEYDKTKKPILLAFYASGNFFMAKHATNPIKKYGYFNRGKKALNEAVMKEPNNLEIRFLRYLCQEKTPKFLGYNKNIEDDKAFVLREYKNSKDEELVKQIKKFLKN